MKLKSIIAISGQIGSGKSFAANLIAKKYDFPIASFGGYLKDYCQKNNLATDRKTLQELGDCFIKENPQRFLIDVISHFLGKADSIILEGVRHRVIFDSITEITDRRISVFMDADPRTRYERYYNRDKELDELKSYDQFVISDNHRVEVETESLKLFCDIIVDSTKEYSSGLLNLISTYLKSK